MNPLFKLNLFVFLFLTLARHGNANTSCEASQKHFASLCFTPTPSMSLDFEWSQKNQPADGWHWEIGNDVLRLHYAEALRGELLSSDDKTLDNACLRAKIEHGLPSDKVVADGSLFGYGNLTSKWNCNASMDFPGVLNCDISSTASKYHEYQHFYITYSDNKNVQIAIACFPTGQAGWVAMSISKSLSDAEKKAVSDHITSIGFSNDDTVVMYDEKSCSNDTK